MSSVLVRPFHRRDRDQLADLVNSHAAAVVPGMGLSVSRLLSQIEREPGEFIVDPWVRERTTLVAELRSRVIAAAHLLRYHADERAGAEYRGIGEVGWLVFWPEVPPGNPYWPDADPAAEMLMAACIGQFEQWGVTRQEADGTLPVPGVYGVPAQWPHVALLFEQSGFAHCGHTEVVYLARVEDLARPGPPVAGLTARRSVGINGTRLSAMLGEETLGYIEVEVLEHGERLARQSGWADVGNLDIAPGYRRRGVASWLLGQAADWLALAQVSRLLDYAWLEGQDPAGQDYAGYRAFLAASGFTELTRTRRGWTRSG